ncbi:MAG: hypothetical protein ACRC18_07090 [Cetobacterium sp.]
MKIPMVAEDPGLWVTLKQAANVIIETGEFIKTLFTDPMTLIEAGIHGLQGSIFSISVVVIAVIILLKMIGFKDMEKWGILTLIIYIVVMIF